MITLQDIIDMKANGVIADCWVEYRTEKNGDLVADLYCTPVKPLEFITLNFSIANNSILFEEINHVDNTP